ncbi:MAG: serine protein kinase PrkA [Myxococcota bacterium]|nr:serine protein kinase PrkA [Myxococcota bacterium]
MTETTQLPKLDDITGAVRDHFQSDRSILSFQEYYEVVLKEPKAQLRSSAQYIKDMFDYFGHYDVVRPTGTVRRFRLFDAEFDEGQGRVAGQEEVQNEIYRVVSNFAREGLVNKMILLHGPNGSAKSSLVRCLMHALEYYSRQPEGALYSFNWIFPRGKIGRDRIGFGGDSHSSEYGESFAYLDPEVIDARIPCDLFDHPIFLIPREQRQKFLENLSERDLWGEDEGRVLSSYISDGDLSYKSRSIFDALIASCDGDLGRVMQHVQVERYFLSRRYRRGLATVEPQMAVDAKIQQLTADRSTTSLPATIQHSALYQPTGPLVDANRGVLEFADFLKRPVEAFKYLLSTVETSTVTMDSFVLHIDLLYIGSTNETYLEAFKQHPDFASFKGRLELIRVPYLRHLNLEKEIYTSTITERVVGKHIAPHSIEVAALWAVMTRLKAFDPDSVESSLKEVITSLTPYEKLMLYDCGLIPERFSTREAKELRHLIPQFYDDAMHDRAYEGIVGASAREVRTLLLNAANHSSFSCLSPQAVFEEIENLLENKAFYAFLNAEVDNGFFDHKAFLEEVRDYYLRTVNDELCDAMGLAPDESYGELFSRYVTHISHWVKNSRIMDSKTGNLRDPDKGLMHEIESTLVPEGEKAEDFRRAIIASIGARALEYPEETPDYAELFRHYVRKLRTAFYDDRRHELRKINEAFLKYADEDDRQTLESAEVTQVEGMLEKLKERYGYTLESARDAVALVLKSLYKDE